MFLVMMLWRGDGVGLSDAEVKAGMAAAGVDLDTLDEFLNDKVPTEFDLDPSELRENDSDIDGICY